MITTIGEICREKGLRQEETVYRHSSREMTGFKIVSGDFYEAVMGEDGKYRLVYKKCVEILDFPMLSRIFPPFGRVMHPLREKMPYFTAGMEDMAGKLYEGKPVAVEGGPCLFGTDEVKVEVVRTGGRKDYFDYNTGKSHLEDGDGHEKNMGFLEFAAVYGGEIQAVHFENRKSGLTPQEWMFIKYPFEIAKFVSGPLVLSIPDMSYAKYLEAVLWNVEEKVRQKALEEFNRIGHEISDLYLDVIGRMQTLYPNVRCEAVHGRDEGICRRFYEARAPYIERNKILRGITRIPEKLESIKDYVSMPALPYYLFGIDNVIEINSMDETDSFRKCRKAHKGDVNLSCILLPELLSKDNVHTIFDAPWDRKEYGNYVVE